MQAIATTRFRGQLRAERTGKNPLYINQFPHQTGRAEKIKRLTKFRPFPAFSGPLFLKDIRGRPGSSGTFSPFFHLFKSVDTEPLPASRWPQNENCWAGQESGTRAARQLRLGFEL